MATRKLRVCTNLSLTRSTVTAGRFPCLLRQLRSLTLIAPIILLMLGAREGSEK